jgi:glycine/D-amino acid oxidase-like deaminating enzyme/nitrite reductase/ring-hydroxylating ferredoxin subunit
VPAGLADASLFASAGGRQDTEDIMQTTTAWETVHLPRFSKVTKSGRFDVVVVGGGIFGLTAGYLLKQAGKSVCLLDRDRLGSGDTGRTTAHLTYVTDRRIASLVDSFGKEATRTVLQAGVSAINTIESLAEAEQIECEFRRVPGYLHASLLGGDSEWEREAKQLQADSELAREMGVDATFLSEVPEVGGPGVRFSNQAKFHPLRYLGGLARALDGDGCAIHENSEVSEVEEKPLAVKVGNKRIECDYLVIATHVPLMGIAGMVCAALFQTKLFPYSSYAISARLPRGEFPEASFWDTSNPYYYLQIDREKSHDRAIFGGEDHKTGQADETAERYTRLESLLKQIAPKCKVEHRWSGQVIETNDGLPYIGETAENQFVGTGFAGNGMTFGTLAATMACDRVLGRENPWQDLFDVGRKQIRGATWKYLKENLDYPYYLVRDRFAGAEAASTREIKRGDGKVIKLDGKQVACSRDAKGKLSHLSAVCTHLGCLVHWNKAEETWDCPCHGSRFRRTGEVLAGPAESPLEEVPVKQAPRKHAPAKQPRRISARSEKQPRPRSVARKTNRRSNRRRSG